ncbi:MAG: lysophospholipid acyltransferase family protein [Sandaracinaceae bacterium]
MLDLDLYRSIRLTLKPPVQRFIADVYLRFDYRKVDIEVHGADRIPEGPVLYAMNHTDNFNYWPFQYWMHRNRNRYTATWVKGKNWEREPVRSFMRLTNNIPIVSRGYLISRDFVAAVGRRPEPDEYRRLRDAVNRGAPLPADLPGALSSLPRDMFGRTFEPRRERYVDGIEAIYTQMMRWFVGLNHWAFGMGLDVLVFPEGTRSVRLSRGRIGVAQAALAFGVPVVPIGCSGCDLVYPTDSAVSKPGRVTYRVGEPILPARFDDLRPAVAFEPFTRDAEHRHHVAFQSVADRIMDAIDPLLDARHQRTDGCSDGSTGVDRFL